MEILAYRGILDRLSVDLVNPAYWRHAQPQSVRRRSVSRPLGSDGLGQDLAGLESPPEVAVLRYWHVCPDCLNRRP